MEAASEGAVDFLAMVADLEAESDADSKMLKLDTGVEAVSGVTDTESVTEGE
jgi:hypothetical protein